VLYHRSKPNQDSAELTERNPVKLSQRKIVI
jgi:hypothetical protein